MNRRKTDLKTLLQMYRKNQNNPEILEFSCNSHKKNPADPQKKKSREELLPASQMLCTENTVHPTLMEDLQEAPLQSLKKRLPWLLALLALGTLVSSVVGIFEEVVAVLPIVICFQSLVLDMAGNVGTQSLAVTIRVLMDENVTGRQKLFLLGKEIRIGLLNGSILGILTFFLLGIFIHLSKSYEWYLAFAVSGCVGVSLVIAMTVSSLVGTLIPMFFHQISIDPAVASGPLITTVNDLVAVISYYGLAYFLLVR